jgi:hypothetical protein
MHPRNNTETKTKIPQDRLELLTSGQGSSGLELKPINQSIYKFPEKKRKFLGNVQEICEDLN